MHPLSWRQNLLHIQREVWPWGASTTPSVSEGFRLAPFVRTSSLTIVTWLDTGWEYLATSSRVLGTSERDIMLRRATSTVV